MNTFSQKYGTFLLEFGKECFKGSYDAYTSLKNERVFSIKPMYIERWIYEDGIPYIETFDVEAQEYKFSRYIGV